jgi:membrane-bound serine protease (ClpP class)
MKFKAWAIISFFLCLWLPIIGSAAENEIYIIQVSSAVNPGTANFVRNAISKAQREKAVCVIIELNTPGGLNESIRNIVINILASEVPVIVYVAPTGAAASSSGVLITMAADIAAMAPGTSLGAPKQDLNNTLPEEIAEMAAQTVAIAEKRGRNPEWVKKIIMERGWFSEIEALDKGIIDIIAGNLDDLIAKIDGREVSGKGVLVLAGAKKTVLKEGVRTRILKTVSEPNIAYLLMMLGLAGLFFEFSHPGIIFPGLVGGVLIIPAAYAFFNLDVNYAGILLIMLAFIFFILEMKISSFGLFTAGGSVLFLTGSLMLFGNGGSQTRISLLVLIPTVVLVSGFFGMIAFKSSKARIIKPHLGESGLVGSIGVVKNRIAPNGKVLVRGELWNAVAEGEIEEGKPVRIIRVDNLRAFVESID